MDKIEIITMFFFGSFLLFLIVVGFSIAVNGDKENQDYNLNLSINKINEVVWDYYYAEWKIFTMLNATCEEITCPCVKEFGCVAYCVECKVVELK